VSIGNFRRACDCFLKRFSLRSSSRLNNRLFNSHLQPSHKRERDRETRSGLNHHPSASSSSPPPSAEKVRTEFSAFCSNELALESFWREVGEGLMKDSTQRERDKEREARDREE